MYCTGIRSKLTLKFSKSVLSCIVYKTHIQSWSLQSQYYTGIRRLINTEVFSCLWRASILFFLSFLIFSFRFSSNFCSPPICMQTRCALRKDRCRWWGGLNELRAAQIDPEMIYESKKIKRAVFLPCSFFFCRWPQADLLS